MSEQRCKTCKHWEQKNDGFMSGESGDCLRVEAWRDGNEDALAYAQGDDASGWLVTRPDFGCVMWEQAQ